MDIDVNETRPSQQQKKTSQQPETLLKATIADRASKLPETDKREKSLAEFLTKMDNYSPIIPDAVTDYYLSRAGFDCDDVRVKRLLALAAQKFVADIATDAFQYCKVRQSGNRSKVGKDRKTVLTMEDLSAALSEYGVNVKKPDYYS
ncbi:transcription initiation factor TFIID 23-30kDa subunit-domain-containing protein [Halteromyces radiatus]|uniref:transcription initiation factor TFIID 23-30kDa subunit-domain-containing protein n=1 Tax=Halteromyces radiatus TaxID=101107 RepID=UPI00221EDCC8|nr:transcription initiation factor TFIID 23-30kDa subunit-domain-containing protein [Halteromyces radiatus]KAI8088754.1 transcription initiation factor TFIID 23-30kDa subunit-domain-containing protein [Halteromyces radiatus]